MSRLLLRTIEDAPEETKASLNSVKNRNGYLPNLLRILANAPVALEAYLTVSATNVRGSLTPAQREAVQITAGATNLRLGRGPRGDAFFVSLAIPPLPLKGLVLMKRRLKPCGHSNQSPI